MKEYNIWTPESTINIYDNKYLWWLEYSDFLYYFCKTTRERQPEPNNKSSGFLLSSQPARERPENKKKHFQIRNFALQPHQVRLILPPVAVWLWRNQIMSVTFRLNKLTTSSWEKFNSCELYLLNKIEKLCWNSRKVSRDKLFCTVHNDNISWKILNLNKF